MNGIWSRTVRDGQGNILPDATIEVREVQDPADADAAPITQATIYDDFSGNTAKANPFTVDSDGRAEFYADGDFYHIVITIEGVEIWYLNQQLGTAQARDLVIGADGNVPAWDANGNLIDSGQSAANIGTGGVDVEDDGTTIVAGSTAINFSTRFSVADDGDTTVTVTLDTTGADAQAVTGTAGASGNLGEWNADGDLVDTGIASSAVFTQSSDVDHDQTTGFVANEHVDHSTVNVNSGDGLTGGGNLTATRTLSLDPAGATAATIAGDDDVLFGDTSNGGAVRRATAQEIADLGGGGAIVFEPPVSSEPSTTESFTNSVTHGAGSQAFVGSVAIPDGRVVLVPRNATAIYLYDPAAGTVTEGPSHGEGLWAFQGGALADDGRVILAPARSSNVGIFDPSDDSYTSGPAHGESGDTAFYGAVAITDGRIVFAPHESPNIGLFDPSDDSYTSGPAHGETTGFNGSFRGATELDDGRVALAPHLSANVGLFDPSDDSYTSGPAHSQGSEAFAGAVTVDDGRVVLAPHASSNVGLFDPSDDSYADGPAHSQGATAYMGAALTEAGLAIFAPYDADTVGIFDPSDDSFSTIAGVTSASSEFQGAARASNGDIVFAPYSNDSVGVYTPAKTDAYAIDFGEDVPDGYVAQGWFQPNETTTPTLRNTGGEPSTAIPIVNRDGSDLAIGALNGAHRLYREAGSPDEWYLLDPVLVPTVTDSVLRLRLGI